VKDLTLPAFSFAVPSLTFSPVDIAQFDVDTFVCNELVQGTGYERCSEAAYSGTPIELNIDARPGSMSIGAAYNFSSLAYIYNSTILNPNTTTLNLAEVFLTATVNCKDLVSPGSSSLIYLQIAITTLSLARYSWR